MSTADDLLAFCRMLLGGGVAGAPACCLRERPGMLTDRFRRSRRPASPFFPHFWDRPGGASAAPWHEAGWRLAHRGTLRWGAVTARCASSIPGRPDGHPPDAATGAGPRRRGPWPWSSPRAPPGAGGLKLDASERRGGGGRVGLGARPGAGVTPRARRCPGSRGPARTPCRAWCPCSQAARLPIRVFSPSIAQLTRVPPFSGVSVKVAWLVASNSLKNSSLRTTPLAGLALHDGHAAIPVSPPASAKLAPGPSWVRRRSWSRRAPARSGTGSTCRTGAGH